MIGYALLLFVLLLLSGFFSSSETAFISLDRVRLQHFVRERRAGASRVAGLLERRGRLLAAILLGNNLVNTGAAAVGTVIAADLVGGGRGALLATLVITVLLVIFGEIGPKTVALRHDWALARAYALPLTLWSRSMRPAVAVFDWLGSLFAGAVGARQETARALTLGELRTAIALGAESGALGDEASEMLLGALTLQQRPVKRIMVPRVSMVTVEAGEPLAEVTSRMMEHGFLRLPVYEGDADNIVGHVHVSDVNAALARGELDRPVREVMRPAVFEPELVSITGVLERMRQRATHMVMLVDEFGGTSGLVTLEDIMEEVIGEIRSESGEEPAERSAGAGELREVEGGHTLHDLGDELDADLGHPEVETVGGLVLAHLRHFPRAGEAVEHAGYRFTVAAADERRVTRVSVERIEADEIETEGDATPDEDAGAGDPQG